MRAVEIRVLEADERLGLHVLDIVVDAWMIVTAASSDASDQSASTLVELLVVADGELDVARHGARLVVVARGVVARAVGTRSHSRTTSCRHRHS